MLQYLRCFGSLVSSLEIDYSKLKRYAYVHHYISTYCVDSLNEVKFSYMPKERMNQFVKPLINVHHVHFLYCELDENLSQFAESFPNLRYLRLFHGHLPNDSDRVYFPHLEELVISGYDNITLTLQNVANLLDSNRQLRSLDIDFPDLSICALLDMIKDHQSITKLTVSEFMQRVEITPLEIERIANEHSLLTELHLKGTLSFTTDNVIASIHQLKSLQTFSFRMENWSVHARIESNYYNQNEWTLTRLNENSNYLKLSRRY